MKVLIACEESQAVCKEFRARGHEAYSCDIIPCSGGHPEWHIQGDALAVINGRTTFTTADGTSHTLDSKWDLLIAHPPCTYLTVSGNRWFNEEIYGDKARQRKADRNDAMEFFMKFVNADCDRIAIENPIGCMSSAYRKPDQTVHPYWFGDAERKATCLWLKGLPKLTATNMVEPVVIQCKSGKTDSPWHIHTLGLAAEERRRLRSKTFPGLAKAMADQWGAIEL
jgi:hypothetical protein